MFFMKACGGQIKSDFSTFCGKGNTQEPLGLALHLFSVVSLAVFFLKFTFFLEMCLTWRSVRTYAYKSQHIYANRYLLSS